MCIKQCFLGYLNAFFNALKILSCKTAVYVKNRPDWDIFVSNRPVFVFCVSLFCILRVKLHENGNPVIEYTETSYTEAEYSAKLEARGIEKLSEVPRVHSVSAQVEQGSMQYRHDYWLGDIVPLKLSAYGIRIRARVSGIKIIYEGTGKQVITMLSEVQEEQI